MHALRSFKNPAFSKSSFSKSSQHVMIPCLHHSGVFFCNHACSFILWHLQSEAFALQLFWCNCFLHLLQFGSLQLAWLPQFGQYKLNYSKRYAVSLFAILVFLLVSQINFLTYTIRLYCVIRIKYSCRSTYT